jgi:hypothetical protein
MNDPHRDPPAFFSMSVNGDVITFHVNGEGPSAPYLRCLGDLFDNLTKKVTVVYDITRLKRWTAPIVLRQAWLMFKHRQKINQFVTTRVITADEAQRERLQGVINTIPSVITSQTATYEIICCEPAPA